ncbi:uncharacterized protein LOC108023673 [Drosophila biarmipes]|uniref:uncharacterized protein LOC108023673 n=1 Tax=Drosophila biarmipes TaxID=125945 RepID=UPI0007E78BB8|nr:uncharacterized protein LOC108023673 [Drosophila biarmipes]
MLSSTFLMTVLVVAMLMLFSAPATEATFFLIACLLRSPICPFITTTTAAG